MGVWSPAFQHQFLDGNLLNFSAAPGLEPSISFEAPVVRPTPVAEDRGFPVRRGNRFSYDFDPGVFPNVIGADIKLEVAFPAGNSAQLLGNITLGTDNIRLLLAFIQGNARIQFVVGNQYHAATAQFDPSSTLSIQARWHSHGTAQIWVNSELRSYDPTFAAGQKLAIDRLSFGHHDTSGTALDSPAFLIRRLTVKLLRDEDSRRALDQLFPIADPVEITDTCRRQLVNFESAVLGEIRGFMQQAIPKLGSSWTAGQASGPFTPEGIAAHTSAVAAAHSFVAFMLHHPGGDPDAVKGNLQDFLTRMRATDPAAYDQTIDRLRDMSGPYDARCLTDLQPVIDRYGAELSPVIELLEAIWTTMQAPGVTP